MSASWTTRFTQQFPCRVPILGAPMARVSGGKLAAETCRAGGLGFIAGGYLSNIPNLDEQIQIFKDTAKEYGQEFPLCIGFIGHACFSSPEGWKNFKYVMETHKPEVVQFFAPSVVDHPTLGNNISLAKSYNAKVMTQVGNVEEAMKALDSGTDALIAQGSEGGGHGLRRELGNGTLSLARTLVSFTRQQGKEIPVLAAGGITDGKGVAAALMLGCDGAVLGTRLWASAESTGNQRLQQRLVEAKSCDDVLRTTAFDQFYNANPTTKSPWPYPYDSISAVRNQTSEKWDSKYDKLAELLTKRDDSNPLDGYRQGLSDGNPDVAVVHSGQGVGLITSIEPAYDLVVRISDEAEEAIRFIQQALPAKL